MPDGNVNKLEIGSFHLDGSNSHFELVSSVLAIEATEPVSEQVTQMAVELVNNHLISEQQKILFHVKTTTNIF
jgi:hypothetical protein